MKTLHWYFPWATALHLYNMTGTGGKLHQLHCYHPFSDSLDIYLTKNHYENYSPKMVPIAKIWGSGSWTYRVGQSREIYSNSVPLSPPHWPYPKRIWPPSWPRVAVALSTQNTKLFTWRTWPKCDWAARSQCGSKQRRADHTKYIWYVATHGQSVITTELIIA